MARKKKLTVAEKKLFRAKETIGILMADLNSARSLLKGEQKKFKAESEIRKQLAKDYKHRTELCGVLEKENMTLTMICQSAPPRDIFVAMRDLLNIKQKYDVIWYGEKFGG